MASTQFFIQLKLQERKKIEEKITQTRYYIACISSELHKAEKKLADLRQQRMLENYILQKDMLHELMMTSIDHKIVQLQKRISWLDIRETYWDQKLYLHVKKLEKLERELSLLDPVKFPPQRYYHRI